MFNSAILDEIGINLTDSMAAAPSTVASTDKVAATAARVPILDNAGPSRYVLLYRGDFGGHFADVLLYNGVFTFLSRRMRYFKNAGLLFFRGVRATFLRRACYFIEVVCYFIEADALLYRGVCYTL